MKTFILSHVTNFNMPFLNKKSFIFYLTKSQIKELNDFKRGNPRGKYFIILSSNQFVKTYKEVIKINSFIYYYKNIRKNKPYNKKSNTPKLLAISDKPYNKQELLSLTENLEKD